jgi:hypothetical protein
MVIDIDRNVHNLSSFTKGERRGVSPPARKIQPNGRTRPYDLVDLHSSTKTGDCGATGKVINMKAVDVICSGTILCERAEKSSAVNPYQVIVSRPEESAERPQVSTMECLSKIRLRYRQPSVPAQDAVSDELRPD